MRFWSERFPAIFKILQEYGLSPEKDIIPLLPAEHFFCGGIETDLMGRTESEESFCGWRSCLHWLSWSKPAREQFPARRIGIFKANISRFPKRNPKGFF
jgi:hypothetical protein